MITDIHSHTWPFPEAFNDDFIKQATAARAGAKVDLTIRLEDYQNSAPAGTRAAVFGGKAKLSGMWVDDEYVASYVARDPEHLVGFLSVDPTQESWEEEMRHGHEELGLRGVKLLPMYAGFGVDDSRLEPLWKYCDKHNLPVLLHTGTTFVRQAPLACTLPRLIEPVATRYPEIRFILAHLSHPYEGECVATIRKHPNVYADISALHYRPWQLYNSLMLVQEYGVWNKLLFGSDYPFTTVNESVDGLRNLNSQLEGTALPRLNEDEIEKLIHRDAFEILGIS
ncbi:MAG: amidohydrolase family protein [Verrucomicrobiales bacterium]|nr:amidohydrolase family protein [Verrucomicrobiales bacterium]